jgi:hypothetical protein
MYHTKTKNLKGYDLHRNRQKLLEGVFQHII